MESNGNSVFNKPMAYAVIIIIILLGIILRPKHKQISFNYSDCNYPMSGDVLKQLDVGTLLNRQLCFEQKIRGLSVLQKEVQFLRDQKTASIRAINVVDGDIVAPVAQVPTQQQNTQTVSSNQPTNAIQQANSQLGLQ